MLTGLIAFCGSKIGKYALGGSALILGFVLLRSHFIHQGQVEGQQQATASLTEVHEKERQQDKAQLALVLDSANKVISAAQAQQQAALEKERRSDQRIAELTNQRTQAQQTLAGVKDQDLHDFIVGPKGLAIRPIADKSLGYNPSEERALATCVSDYPICRDTLKAQGDKLGSIADQVSALSSQVNQFQAKYTALAGYTTTVERDYVDLYNAFPRRGNRLVRFVTFGLAGKPHKIPTPDPNALFSTKGGQ